MNDAEHNAELKGQVVTDQPSNSGSEKRIGILLVNLGTPEATDFWSVRRYLKEFLSDPRVVETPKLLWWPILNLVILSTRPARSGKAYQRIWNKDKNESPLKTITRAQADALAHWVAAGGLTPKQDAERDRRRLGHALRQARASPT